MSDLSVGTQLPGGASPYPEIGGQEGVLVTQDLIFNSTPGAGPRLATIVIRTVPPMALFVLVLLAWQFLVPVYGLRDYQLPVPSRIWQAFQSVQSTLIGDGWFTFWNEAFRGYLIGSGLGFIVAVAAWRFRPIANGVMPYAVISSSVPIVALAPALVAIAGSDWQSKVVICAIMTVFPMALNAYRGLRAVDAQSRELLQTYAASRWEMFGKLHLPASLPFIFNALKINATLAMIGAIVAEYFGSPTQGLGLFISNNAGNNVYPDVWAGVFVACVIGITFYCAILLIERRLTSWHISYRTR